MAKTDPEFTGTGFFLFLLAVSASIRISLSQSAATCNGIFVSYNYTGGRAIAPTDPTNQPYRFEATLTVLNNGLDELKSWQVFVGFQHDEHLVSVSNAILADGSTLPARVGNGTILAGFPDGDLETAVETAGDTNQMESVVQLIGTEFGIPPSDIPLPANITLLNDGYSCPSNYTMQGNYTMEICCNRSLSSVSNRTTSDGFLPRQEGDLIIMYDVMRAYDSYYFARVTISNHNPIGRLENWRLSWEWTRKEFIYSMKGAYPYVVGTSDCVLGDQGQFYKDLDFSQALNCERSPTIVDLPPDKANDTSLGLVKSCCRNGTILPLLMDPEKSESAFEIQVYKMPPDLNRTIVVPPAGWRINGTMSSTYECGSPIPVSPSRFPSPLGLPTETSAISSWQVVCNITRPERPPKCCVSFSAFYNDSVVPCSTCACGCPAVIPGNTCSSSAPALLLDAPTLLLPFENRTEKALAWAKLKHRTVPDPLPCGDNCGVSINWHLNSDYKSGWTARMTVFNWDSTLYPDWFTAVQLGKAGPGFEQAYSFNGTLLSTQNNTIFLEGLPGLNYLLGESDGKNPKKDPRVPGTQQSVILFSKKTTPNIDVSRGDGFPTKVIFNGEECALPTIFPTNTGYRTKKSAWGFTIFLPLMLFIFL